MVLTSLLALVPAAGTALCLGDRGHLAIELIERECPPSEHGGLAASCTPECGGCEDVPLSVESAERIASRHELPGADDLVGFSFFAPARVASPAAGSPPTVRPAACPSPSLRRPALLRC